MKCQATFEEYVDEWLLMQVIFSSELPRIKGFSPFYIVTNTMIQIGSDKMEPLDFVKIHCHLITSSASLYHMIFRTIGEESVINNIQHA